MEPSGFILTNHANHGRVIFFIHFHPVVVVMVMMMIVIVNSGIVVVVVCIITIRMMMMRCSSVAQTGWRRIPSIAARTARAAAVGTHDDGAAGADGIIQGLRIHSMLYCGG